MTGQDSRRLVRRQRPKKNSCAPLDALQSEQSMNVCVPPEPGYMNDEHFGSADPQSAMDPHRCEQT
jgi:hypothetical protein